MRLAIAVVLLVSECTPAAAPLDAGPPDAATDVDRRFYALSDVQAVFDEDGGIHGVDLDGIDSTGDDDHCASARDDASWLDPSEHGVDNVFAHFLSQQLIVAGTCSSTVDYACSTRVWREDIASGERIWVIEIAQTADSLEVALHRGQTVGAVRLDDGRLATNQAFTLDELARTTEASIDGPMLRARFPQPVELELLLGGDEAGVARVHRLEIAALLYEGAPTVGTIGGALAVDEVVAMVTDPAQSAEVRALLGATADLDPDPEDPRLCRQLSFGLGFETVAAIAAD